MEIEEKKKKLNDYKQMLDDLRKLKNDNKNNNYLVSHFNHRINNNKTKKMVKQSNGFTNVVIPIVITVFIIGFAVGLAFAIYKF